MTKNRIIFFGAGLAALVLGIALVLTIQKPAQQTAPATVITPAKVAPAVKPDGAAALRDLFGSKKPANLLPEPWASLEFKFAGVPQLVWFIALKGLDDTGKPQDCHACSPTLAAVTYKQDASGWSLSAVDSNVGEFGSYGHPPQKLQFSELPFGSSSLALAFEDSGGGQGYTNTFQGILRFDGHWNLLGFVPVAEDNAGTGACGEDKGKCWSWQGELKVGATSTNGVPDLVVERKGKVSADAGGASAASMTYAFDGSKYEEKSKVEAAQAAAAAKAAKTVSLSELRRMAATGMKTYTTYWVSTMINGNDNFGDQLCDSVRYDGYCELNRDSVRVAQDLPTVDARRALYDSRGRRGTSLCAQVEMRPDGQVYLTNYSPGTCR